MRNSRSMLRLSRGRSVPDGYSTSRAKGKAARCNKLTSSTKMPSNSAFSVSASSDAASRAARLWGEASRATRMRRIVGSSSRSFIPRTPPLRYSKRQSLFRQRCQAGFNPLIHTASREFARVVALPCRYAGQELDPLIDCVHRIDPELSGGDRGHNVVAEHQVLDVRGRDQHPLLPRQPLSAADIEEPLDLLVHAADGLHLA